MRTLTLTIVAILLSLCSTNLSAQKLSDTVLNAMSRTEWAKHYQAKSRTGKIVGFALLAGGTLTAAIGIQQSINDQNSEALLLLGFSAMAISNPVLCRAARNAGKADILFRDPVDANTNESLVKDYRRKATIGSIAAWGLFLGGFAGLFVSAGVDNGTLLVLSTAAMGASLPVWTGAAKNKGRLMILTGTEPMPANPAGASSYRKLGIGIPIGR